MKPLFTGSEWNFKLLQEIDGACQEIAVEELKLDFYPNQIEVITSEQMLDVYASSLPVSYRHWSKGKAFVREEHNYRKGYSGLAYEVVFNTSPCVAYLMEENSATMQALVIAHASYGHNSFFASNYLFKEWTDASSILDYLIFAREYINECEQKYGVEAVEAVLDSCHALKYYGVDKYKRPSKPSRAEEERRRIEKSDADRLSANALWDRVVPKKKTEGDEEDSNMMDPQENLLYFLEKNAPNLQTWQREVIRIVRKISQYLYPQLQTQVMNEGWASTVHYYIMTRLHEKGQITDGSYMEFLHSHTSVLTQRSMTRQFNPYWLGFNMFADIKRICTEPTKEDSEWFPDLANTNWLEAWHYAKNNFRDESFITQYLSPKMIRDNHMFLLDDDSDADEYDVARIHNERGYKDIRDTLSNSKKLSNMFADIQIVDVDFTGDRTMFLEHKVYDGIKLDEKTALQTVKHIKNLWGYPVELISLDTKSGNIVDMFGSEEEFLG